MCLEFLRRFITRHEMIRCPSKTIEDGVVLRFSLVDLSRRRAVLLRGGPRRKGSGGIITYMFPSLPPPFPCTLELTSVILFVLALTATTELAVVLLYGAVVPQAPAVVPMWVTVVPWLPGLVPLRYGSRGGCNFLHPGPHGSTARPAR